LSGSRSTIAEKSQRSRGSIGLVMGRSLRCAVMIRRCAAMFHPELRTFAAVRRPRSDEVRHIRGVQAGRIGYALLQTAE
jgi:hypothetical protein